MDLLSGYTVGQAFLIGVATGMSFAALFAAWLLMTEGE
jgi:hypothetical protein